MTNAPYAIIQGTGNSKPGRDLLDITSRLGVDFGQLDLYRQAMIQETDTSSGTLSVRGDNTSGQVTLASGHGIVTGQLFDIAWSGGARSAVVAGTVSGNNIPIGGGTGDNLPVQDTALTSSHYATVANVVKFNTGDGSTIDPNTACRAFHEIASFYAICSAALLQLVARFKQ